MQWKTRNVESATPKSLGGAISNLQSLISILVFPPSLVLQLTGY